LQNPNVVNGLHRKIIAIRCQFSDFAEKYQSLLRELDILWISDASNTSVKTTPFKQAFNKLGQETNVVVFDASQTLAVNALGAISGCILGGGLILLLPENAEDYQHSAFYQRLLRILSEHHIPIIDSIDFPKSLLAKPFIEKPRINHPVKRFEATGDQKKVIGAIKKVVTGHRNRPLVITSNRGRGKSSAIGMAINDLLSTRPIKIIVCAPAKAMVTSLLDCAGKHEDLHYIAVDELVRELPKAGLVVIDEAGAIPVPLLSKLLERYSRLVFATTLHGYEGNGRGFAIRFHDQLNQFTPNWRSIELTHPIRWSDNDPLEALINDLLLLDSEFVELAPSEQTMPEKLVHKKITASELLSNEPLLRQLFGLLVVAHYQTKPSDLLQILDSQRISIYAMFSGKALIATAIVSHEGGLEFELATAIYEGKRRPKGHLVPQILLSQMGIIETATLKTDRIMRIATHPSCRKQGLANHLLSVVSSDSTADYLSTSFGLSQNLLLFWQKANYVPVYLGLKREASSGCHSALLLQALTKDGQALAQIAEESFPKNLVAQLGDSLKHYDAELAFQLLRNTRQGKANLCRQEIRDIKRFIRGQCGLDSAIAALQHWLPETLMNDKYIIKNNEAKLLIMRILQHHNWSHCCEVLEIPSKQIAQRRLQDAVSVLAESLPNMDVSKEGLTRC